MWLFPLQAAVPAALCGSDSHVAFLAVHLGPGVGVPADSCFLHCFRNRCSKSQYLIISRGFLTFYRDGLV